MIGEDNLILVNFNVNIPIAISGDIEVIDIVGIVIMIRMPASIATEDFV